MHLCGFNVSKNIKKATLHRFVAAQHCLLYYIWYSETKTGRSVGAHNVCIWFDFLIRLHKYEKQYSNLQIFLTFF
jgi:hypothetical protein